MGFWKQLFLECNSPAVPRILRKKKKAAAPWTQEVLSFPIFKFEPLLSDLHFFKLKWLTKQNLEEELGSPVYASYLT